MTGKFELMFSKCLAKSYAKSSKHPFFKHTQFLSTSAHASFVETELPKTVKDAVAQALDSRRSSISSTPSRLRTSSRMSSPPVPPATTTSVTPTAAGVTTSSRKSLQVTPATPTQQTNVVAEKVVSSFFTSFIKNLTAITLFVL